MRAFLLLALLFSFGGVHSASNPPSPTPTKSTQPIQSESTNPSHTANNDKRGTKDVPLVVDIVRAPDTQKREQWEREKGNKDTSINQGIEIFSGLLFLATIVLGGVGVCQVIISRQQITLAREEFETTQRAYVSVKFIKIEPVIDTIRYMTHPPSGTVDRIRAWKIIPVFFNSGSTPTKNAVMHVNFEIRKDAIPDKFDWPDRWPDGEPPRYSRFFIGPQSEKWSAPIELSIVDLDAARKGERRIFIWGWIDYNDIIRDDPRHRTEFSSELIVHTDPTRQESVFTFREFSEFNGTDDECDQEPKPYKEMQI